ncbi:MAG: 5-(carboxyamino)imidazole ribonucleotide mutase [Lentisphaerae bacterium]|nr:5-(carboxyamino)imidazole ribonucleotide mutase [Lentisphaerota bacterium]MCP4103779.1 5-(carboxyamino)imidazole ribonucleotide mutase [Lentisphaerota bacterium]
MSEKPVVAILMGSKSDLPILRGAFQIFDQFGIPFTARVMSAHRTPEVACNFAANAESEGIKVIICAAGMAAHLGGVVAAHTTLPVIGIPVASEPFNALDSLLATVQMPPGIPVAAVTAGKAGGKNAALYAISILATGNAELGVKLKAFRADQTAKVQQADAELQQELEG